MKNILHKNNKLEIRKSPIHGYGVFARENIKVGEILEECHHIRITAENNQRCNCIEPELLPYKRYTFSFPYTKTPDATKPYQYDTLVLGYGSIYNSSTCSETNNADVSTDLSNNIFIFIAAKDILAGEEILIYYGDNWWKRNGELKENK